MEDLNKRTGKNRINHDLIESTDTKLLKTSKKELWWPLTFLEEELTLKESTL